MIARGSIVIALVTAFALVLACTGKPKGHPSLDPIGPGEHTRRDLELSPEQERALAELAARADANPNDFAARKASGLAHMNFTLAGVLRLQGRAEQDLEAAFALDSSDAQLDRSLGRFYNMRAVAGDGSKADMQVRVYHALLGDQDPLAMSDSDFVAHSFFALGQILAKKNRGKNLDALAHVSELEDQLAARVARAPDNIELHALAGNFAFFFAGNIPLARERRVREAVGYFEVVRARWDELRPGAKDPEHCPNTRENFMFELAEGHMVLGQAESARVIYEELAKIEGSRTRAKELIAFVASERLRNFDAYLGEMRLMPPWPSDVGNCVVCHAWNAEVGLESLWVIEPIEPIMAEDVPSKAEYKPIGAWLSGGEIEAAKIEGRERLPEPVASLIERECAPCHFPGGEVVGTLDLSSAEAVVGAATWIDARVGAGEMPPDRGLSEADRAIVQEWAALLAP
jgi:hypothetical protein